MLQQKSHRQLQILVLQDQRKNIKIKLKQTRAMENQIKNDVF